MKSRQETFDFVLNFLRKQGKPSMGDDDTCLYRGPNGLKCAAGCLIPDDKYDPIMETNNAIDSPVAGVLMELNYDPVFVRTLQSAHDMSAWTGDFLENIEKEFQVIAEENNLVYNPPD